MRLSLLTWNSISINTNAPFTSYLQVGQLSSLAKNPMVNRSDDYPALTGVVRQSSVLVIGVLIKSGYDNDTYREILKGYFFGDDDNHTIVAEDLNDSNKQYYRTGIPIRMVQESASVKNSFYITIQTDYPYWQMVTASVDSWDITASGDSDIVANAGNIFTKPVFQITPTTTKTKGLKYRRYSTIYNVLDKSVVLPLEITNGGLDVQALIDANKMQADGDDFLIWKDGAFSDRWLYDMDSDSDPALCWNNFSLTQKHEGTTLSTFDSDDTVIYFTETNNNLSFLQYIKTVSNRSLLIESEILSFADSDVNTFDYTISNILRGQKNTVAVSHAASSTVRHLEHDTWIMYGDSDLGTPDIDDTFKPMFDLSSTNQVWGYSNYFDTSSKRPGAWKGEILRSRTNLSYVFTDSDPTTAINPSNVLGMAMIGSQSKDNPIQETGTLDWLLNHPCGITDVSFQGSIYYVASWPAVVGLQYLLPNAVWYTIENEVKPTTSQAWQSVSLTDVSLGGTYENIRFAVDGSLGTSPNDKAMAQFHSISVTFDSDNLPVINLESEETINFFNFKLTNNTTGEWIKVITPCPINTILTIDCENKLAYLADGTRVDVRLSSDRTDWLNLKSGNNSLQYDDVGTVAVHININHRDRNL